MPRSPTRCARRAGFTLVELLISMAVLAILLSLAWPSYQASAQKGRRADAMASLAQLMQAQERWRSEHASYQATIGDLPGTGATSAEGHYTISVVEATANGYTAQATAKSGSPQARDTTCKVMQVVVAGGNITYSSKTSADAANATPDPCWIK